MRRCGGVPSPLGLFAVLLLVCSFSLHRAPPAGAAAARLLPAVPPPLLLHQENGGAVDNNGHQALRSRAGGGDSETTTTAAMGMVGEAAAAEEEDAVVAGCDFEQGMIHDHDNEECLLQRRLLRDAHLDYIYTQHKGEP